MAVESNPVSKKKKREIREAQLGSEARGWDAVSVLAVSRPDQPLRQTLRFLACPGPTWTPDSFGKVKGAWF